MDLVSFLDNTCASLISECHGFPRCLLDKIEELHHDPRLLQPNGANGSVPLIDAIPVTPSFSLS